MCLSARSSVHSPGSSAPCRRYRRPAHRPARRRDDALCPRYQHGGHLHSDHPRGRHRIYFHDRRRPSRPGAHHPRPCLDSA